jgi:TRAP transporter TAXI family solute receptor
MRTVITALGMGFLAAVAGAQVVEQVSIRIASGARGGAALAMAEVLSRIYAAAIPGTKTATQATRTAAEGLQELAAGRAELAFTPGGVLTAAWRGDEQAGFKLPLDSLRGVSATHDTYVQFVARADSRIRTIADLKGKRVSVGVARSPAEINARAMLRGAGLSYKDLAKVEYLPYGQSAELLKDRQLDVTLQSTTAGAMSLRDLATATELVVVAIPADVVAKAGAAYRPATIPAHTYPGQASDVPTAAIRNYLVTRSGVPDELAYRMTKALYEHLPELAAAQSVAKAITLDNAVTGMPVPLHPGAEQYYREVGAIK